MLRLNGNIHIATVAVLLAAAYGRRYGKHNTLSHIPLAATIELLPLCSFISNWLRSLSMDEQASMDVALSRCKCKANLLVHVVHQTCMMLSVRVLSVHNTKEDDFLVATGALGIFTLSTLVLVMNIVCVWRW